MFALRVHGINWGLIQNCYNPQKLTNTIFYVHGGKSKGLYLVVLVAENLDRQSETAHALEHFGHGSRELDGSRAHCSVL